MNYACSIKLFEFYFQHLSFVFKIQVLCALQSGFQVSHSVALGQLSWENLLTELKSHRSNLQSRQKYIYIYIYIYIYLIAFVQWGDRITLSALPNHYSVSSTQLFSRSLLCQLCTNFLSVSQFTLKVYALLHHDALHINEN